MFWECTRRLGHDVVDGKVCSNVGFIQGKWSNIYYKCTDGWIKLVLRSTSSVCSSARSSSLSKERSWEGVPVVAG